MRDDPDGLPFALDLKRLRQRFERSAPQHDRTVLPYREIGQGLLERLDSIKLQPAVIVDVGCGAGLLAAALLKKYRKARVIGLERAPALVHRARRRAPWLRTLYGAVGEPEALPLPAASCDLLVSNLALPWSLDLDRVFAEFRRVLKPGGALFFSTLGPDTLIELRRAWAAVDDYNHLNAFFDMHDIGDALVRAGLAEPVMDVERLTLAYATVDDLMRALKHFGVGNITTGRARGLTGKGRLHALRAACEPFRRADGRLPASCEVIYGHAWGPRQSHSDSRPDGSAVFPLAQLRRRAANNS
ncbi:MAG: methyltransferase domain-containing protein [Candidatus Competibacteraceae bacterium]